MLASKYGFKFKKKQELNFYEDIYESYSNFYYSILITQELKTIIFFFKSSKFVNLYEQIELNLKFKPVYKYSSIWNILILKF